MSSKIGLVTIEEFLHPIMPYVSPLISFEGSRGLVAGTCVLITPYLAITAKHVIQKMENFYGKDKLKNLNIYISQFHTDCIWHVSYIRSWIGTDIAVLILYPRNEKAKLCKFQICKW